MLPKIIDPRKNADQNMQYQGSLQADSLNRLAEAVEEVKDDIHVDVQLYRDEQRRMRIRGEIEADVGMICQRCLQPCGQSLRANLDLVMLHNEEQAKALPKDLDFWLVAETANLYELIEDELLLAMPIVAYHPEGTCEAPADYETNQLEEAGQDEEKRQSPFAILKELTSSSD